MINIFILHYLKR